MIPVGLNVFSPPQLLIRSIRTLPKQIIGLNIFVRLKGGLVWSQGLSYGLDVFMCCDTTLQGITYIMRHPSNKNLCTLKLVLVPLQ